MAKTINILLFTTFLLYLSTSTFSNDLSHDTNNLPSQLDNGNAGGDHQAPEIRVSSKSSRPKRLGKKTHKKAAKSTRIKPITVLPKPSKKYCVPKPNISDEILQANIDWACKMGVDCDPLVNTKEVSCSDKSLWIKAAYVMNNFFNANGRNESTCDFNNSGFLTLTNPSDGKCAFI